MDRARGGDLSRIEQVVGCQHDLVKMWNCPKMCFRDVPGFQIRMGEEWVLDDSTIASEYLPFSCCGVVEKLR